MTTRVKRCTYEYDKIERVWIVVEDNEYLCATRTRENAKRIADGLNKVYAPVITHHGSTADCPSPNPNGSCPGHEVKP
ncbi:MAG: hypothetical protein DMG32_16285 [Acidobacteria bacterium]|nr:MAG: hypothetical protein DMG32_16285 [Acidobacteriota bacterium]